MANQLPSQTTQKQHNAKSNCANYRQIASNFARVTSELPCQTVQIASKLPSQAVQIAGKLPTNCRVKPCTSKLRSQNVQITCESPGKTVQISSKLPLQMNESHQKKGMPHKCIFSASILWQLIFAHVTFAIDRSAGWSTGSANLWSSNLHMCLFM